MKLNYETLRIYISERPEYMGIDVWVIVREFDYDYNISVDDGMLTLTKIDPTVVSNESKPFLRVPRNFADLLFKRIAEYNSERGMRTQTEDIIEGKLIATELHLKDMQDISRRLLEFVTK